MEHATQPYSLQLTAHSLQFSASENETGQLQDAGYR